MHFVLLQPKKKVLCEQMFFFSPYQDMKRKTFVCRSVTMSSFFFLAPKRASNTKKSGRRMWMRKELPCTYVCETRQLATFFFFPLDVIVRRSGTAANTSKAHLHKSRLRFRVRFFRGFCLVCLPYPRCFYYPRVATGDFRINCGKSVLSCREG